MKPVILVVVYNLERAREHEWFVDYIDRKVFDIEFVLIKQPDSELARYLVSRGVKVHKVPYSGKYSLPILIWRLMKLIIYGKYAVVHAHLFEASIAAMIAAWVCRVPNRIVTRHHSDFHHSYFPGAVKFDKIINFLSTRLIAVSDIVADVLINREAVDPSKITIIFHGIEMRDFDMGSIDDSRYQALTKKYQLPAGGFVVGAVSRFIEWKGLDFIIEAFSDFHSQHPNSVLILANAAGPGEKEVLDKLLMLDVGSYRLIQFESDMPALYKCFSCFVHVPVSKFAEAFGQIYIESFAAGLPTVLTISGVASSIAKHEYNCLVVPYKDSVSINQALHRIHDNPAFAKELGGNAHNTVAGSFTVNEKYIQLQKLYSELCFNHL